jgi:hypothetical protein
VTVYVFIGIFQALTIGALVWGTGWIIWNRLRRWRRSRRQDR